MVHIDDSRIFYQNRKRHCKHLATVLDRLRGNHPLAPSVQSIFFKEPIDFLGVHNGKHSIKVDLEKLG